MRKTLVFILTFLMIISTTSCVNIYNDGVEFPDFPDRDVPIYDDAVVFEYDGDDEESEIVYGTEDDVDDVVDFYKEEFEDEDYIIVKEKEDKDEYEVEGYIDDIFFEIEAEEASGEEKDYFDCVVTISVEIVDEDEIAEALVLNTKKATQENEPEAVKTEETITAVAEIEETITYGSIPDVLKVMFVLPYDESDIEDNVDSLQSMLANELNMDVEITMVDDYNKIILSMAAGEAHVGTFTGIQYIVASSSGSAEAILKSLRYDVDIYGNPRPDLPLLPGYYSQLFVHKDSGITNVNDLAGKKIAIPSYVSTLGFVWPANFLADNGIDPVTDVDWIEVGGYDSTILAVMNGEADAAFSFIGTRTVYFSEAANYAEILETCVPWAMTSIIPMDVISVVSGLDTNLKEKIAQAFINIIATDEGYALLNELYSHEGYAKAKDADYDQVRLYLQRKDEWGYD